MYIKEADIPTTTLRFAVGTRVECNCGGWEGGTVVKTFYRCALRRHPRRSLCARPCAERARRPPARCARRQSSFPPGTFAPYQIQLDNGKLIYAPIDEDRVIREAVVEPPIGDGMARAACQKSRAPGGGRRFRTRPAHTRHALCRRRTWTMMSSRTCPTRRSWRSRCVARRFALAREAAPGADADAARPPAAADCDGLPRRG